MTKVLEALRQAGVRGFPEVKALFEASPYCLQVTERGTLYGLRYDRAASDFRAPVVRQARGLVLRKESNEIVSRAFDKFYEYGEDSPSYRERPNLRRSMSNPNARYEQKYDGTLIKVIRHAGEPDGLLVSTNGKIDAGTSLVHRGWFRRVGGTPRGEGIESSYTFRQAFADAGGLSLDFKEGFCYAFELLHPDVPTVVPATDVSLVHLMTRRLADDFDELPPEEMMYVPGRVRPAEVAPFKSFGACADAARVLPWDDEGYVVIEESKQRIKVKAHAYKAMQRLLVDDSEYPEADALSVALTLHKSHSKLPCGPVGEAVNDWRRHADRFASTCAARIGACRQRPGSQSARKARANIEASLGGRVPRSIRTALASAFSHVGNSSSGNTHVDGNAVLDALRASSLHVEDVLDAVKMWKT
eukprot:TRINITY_DN51094_c0_g1_i1.p1 TRINITY_DN51094_c0_g1~~TRINITY_DN51094_c0_g1_i1.p1  ORF type:complete len:416 (+),score=59.32 TRINITY_DN51094_c0_g1_i1:144-1391(+)